MEREKLVDLLTDLTLATLHTVSDLAAGES
jgi:hypothetical protein